jgi:hypothetical protein
MGVWGQHTQSMLRIQPAKISIPSQRAWDHRLRDRWGDAQTRPTKEVQSRRP